MLTKEDCFAGGLLVGQIPDIVLQVFEDRLELDEVVGIDIDERFMGFEGGFGRLELIGQIGVK